MAAAGDGFRCGNDCGRAHRAGRGLLGHPGLVPRLAAPPAVPGGGLVPADARRLARRDGRRRPALAAAGRRAIPHLAGCVARGRGRRLPQGRGDRGAAGHPARPGGRRPGLVLAHLHDGDGQRRAGPQRPGRLRPAPVAAPGAYRPGPDHRARVRAAAAPRRERGRRGHDPDGAPPGPAAGRPAVPPAALASGGAGHHRDRQDHPALEAVGRVHDQGDGAARGGPPAAPPARRAGLQGRGRFPADRRPGPAGAARRGGHVHRDLAGRGQPVAVGAAAPSAGQHPG